MEFIKIDRSLFSKKKIEEVRNELFEKVLNGEIDALEVQMAIVAYEKIFNGDDKKNNGLKHKIKQQVLKSFEPYGKQADLYNFKVETAEAGVKYDYTNDAIWLDINQKLEAIKEDLKTRESQLKVLKMPDRDKGEKNNFVINPETGEMYEEMPPNKTSSSIVKFTLKG